MKQSELDFINNLRQISPYVEMHRGKTLVVYLPSALINLNDSENTPLLQFAKDIVLLNTLGIKTLIALGAESQLNTAFKHAGLAWSTHANCRITEPKHLTLFKQTIGQVRAAIEAAFTQASADHAQGINITSGNWITAKPKGIIDGVDFQHTGSVRKIHHQAIADTLNTGHIALLTPLSYSLTGEVFNLNTLEQAFSVAKILQADKLMVFTPESSLVNLPSDMNANSLKQVARDQTLQSQSTPLQERLLSLALSSQQAIKRIHFIDQAQPSAILLELFSRDGVGTLISMDKYHQTRQATIDDVSGILTMISPLETQGILVKRSRERLELEISNFIVMTRDDHVIGCAALYPITQTHAELACLVVNKDYQGQSLGKELLDKIEKKAKRNHVKTLLLLTTHTHHWFIEHGFSVSNTEALPKEKQALYNFKRQSKVLNKSL